MIFSRSHWVVAALTLGMALVPASALAARLTIVPSVIQAQVGDMITADVILDTQGESINAVDLTILYPALLSGKAISKAGSVMTLWAGEPSFTRNTISLRGGVPGGVVTSHGLIARVTLAANAVGQGSITFDSANSLVLLNDGAGTATNTVGTAAQITIVPRPAHAATSPTPSPSPLAHTDHQRPQSFAIEVGRDPGVFQGKYFASFYTTDPESGVDHYELKEASSSFALARSPYLLSDQRLHSVITVRAYDTAGNWRQEMWPRLLTRIWWWIKGVFGFH